MTLIRYGMTSTGGTWGIAEDRHGFWLIVGADIHEVFEAVAEGLATECFPSYEHALAAAREL